MRSFRISAAVVFAVVALGVASVAFATTTTSDISPNKVGKATCSSGTLGNDGNCYTCEGGSTLITGSGSTSAGGITCQVTVTTSPPCSSLTQYQCGANGGCKWQAGSGTPGTSGYEPRGCFLVNIMNPSH